MLSKQSPVGFYSYTLPPTFSVIICLKYFFSFWVSVLGSVILLWRDTITTTTPVKEIIYLELAYNFMLVHVVMVGACCMQAGLMLKKWWRALSGFTGRRKQLWDWLGLLESQSLSLVTLFSNKATSPSPCQIVPLPDDKHSNPWAYGSHSYSNHHSERAGSAGKEHTCKPAILIQSLGTGT